MAFVCEHGTLGLNGSIGNAWPQHVIKRTWTNKTISYRPWKWKKRRACVICHFHKRSHGNYVWQWRKRVEIVCWTQVAYHYHFIILTFLLKYLFLWLNDHFGSELVLNNSGTISFIQSVWGFISLCKWLAKWKSNSDSRLV